MKKQTVFQFSLFTFFVCGFTLAAFAGLPHKKVVHDSITVQKEDRNVLLNASDANKPREVPLGLPAGDVTVYENQLPAVYSSSLHNLSAHWRNDAGIKGITLMNPMESAISTGNIAYTVVSSTKTGNSQFEGLMNYQGNHYGWQQFDLNLSGPLGKGCYYAVTMYQNFDPGTFKLKFTDFQDRMQLYRGVLSKKWRNGGELNLIYKYTNNHRSGFLASFAPFIYVGDGSVKEVDGFSLGTTSYLPEDGKICYRDLVTGEKYESNFRNGLENKAHDFGLSLNHVFDNGVCLQLNTRYSYADVASTDVNGTTITDIVDGKESGTNNLHTYYMNGQPFSGKRQGSVSYLHLSKVQNFLLTAELNKQLGNHDIRSGLNEWWYKTDYHSNSTMFDRTVEAYPSRIQHKEGDNMRTFYNYNAVASEYYRGTENRTAIYLSDRWKISPKWEIYLGARLEYFRLRGDNLPYERFEDFNMNTKTGDGQNITPQKFSRDDWNYAFSAQVIYHLNRQMGITADATVATYRPGINNYASSFNPSGEASKVPLLRGGLFYNNPWLNVTSMVTYISKTNNYSFMNISNPELNTDSRTVAFNYNIQTLGWTTTIEANPFKGFHLHLLFTLQEPKYNDYETNVTFGDKTYPVSATGKIVTGISKYLLEIDPSYQITDELRFWMSFRYFSKQYANLSNALYFNGHWETFAGINYKVNKLLSLHANVVNFLNQTGATGTISGAELIPAEEAAQYNNHWMTGSYLRPLTFEFGAKLTF